MGHLARMITIEEISRVYPPLGFFFESGQIATVHIRDLGLSLLPLGLAFLGGYVGTILVRKLGRRRVLIGSILL